MSVRGRIELAKSALGSAVGFLTVLGPATPPGPSSLGWFPVVGAALGGVLGGLWWAASRAFSPLVAAGVVVTADVALTGALHLDGLADAADGLLPPLPRTRRLEVMADPAVGAFGVTAVVVALGMRTVALSSLTPSALLLAGLWAASRTCMAAAAAGIPYARTTGGLVSAFIPAKATGASSVGDPSRAARAGRALRARALSGLGHGPDAGVVGEGDPGSDRAVPAGSRPRAARSQPLRTAVVGLVLALGCGFAWRPVAGPVAVAAGSLGAGGVALVARRRLGGVTGDVLGAAGVVCETVGLVVAAARW